MTYKTSYIKEIENHFLFLIGKGIMLCPRDYNLIMKWKKLGVPKEVIYRGMSRAVEELRKRRGGELPRTIADCSLIINEEIENYRRSGETGAGTGSGKDQIIQKSARRLAEIAKAEKRREIRAHYIEARNKVLALMNRDDEENIFDLLERIGEEIYEAVFQALEQNEKLRIGQAAEAMIDKKRERLMSDNALRETLISLRNDVLKKDYGLKNILQAARADGKGN